MLGGVLKLDNSEFAVKLTHNKNELNSAQLAPIRSGNPPAWLYLQGFYYLEAEIKSDQGTKANPYVYQKTRVPNNIEKLELNNFDESPSHGQYKDLELYESKDSGVVDEILLNDDSATTYYVKIPHVTDESSAIWYQVTTYRHDPYEVSVVNDGNGSASANLKLVEVGEEVTLTATPNTGYQFKEWQVVAGGVTIKDNKFVMPDKNVEVKAIFEEKTFYTYQIITGADQTWEQGSKKDVVIEVDAPEDKFKGLEYFGGPSIDEKNYKVEEGSTIITIFAEYLESLDAGEKILHILYSDYDPIQTTLTIKAKASGSNDEQTIPEKPEEEEKPKEDDPKEEKPEEEPKVDQPEDKLPGMGDNHFLSYLALLLIALGSILTVKSKPQE